MALVSRHRVLTMLAVLVGVAVGGCLFLTLPPAPCATWPARGSRMFLSPDGRLVAIVEVEFHKVKRVPGFLSGPPPSPEQSNIRVHDLWTGREVAFLCWKDHAEVRCLDFSPDGRRLAAVDVWSGELREWEIESGKELLHWTEKDVEEHTLRMRVVAYSPTGELRALTSLDGSQCLWDPRKRAIVATLATKDDSVESEPSVPRFLVAKRDGSIVAWRLDTGDVTGGFLAELDGFRSPTNFTLSADGKLFLLGSEEEVQIWDAQGGHRRLLLNVSRNPKLSPDNRRLAAFAWHNLNKRRPSLLERAGLARPPNKWSTLTLYDLEAGAELGVFPDANVAEFTPDGKYLAVLTEDGAFQLWDGPPRPPWLRIVGFGGLAGAAVFGLGVGVRNRSRNVSSKRR